MNLLIGIDSGVAQVIGLVPKQYFRIQNKEIKNRELAKYLANSLYFFLI